jgi:hypothetical protein
MHLIVIIRPMRHSRLGQSDCYQDNNKLFHSDRRQRKTKLQKGVQYKQAMRERGEGIWVYISLLIINKRKVDSMRYCTGTITVLPVG